jgi:hypothetical protein
MAGVGEGLLPQQRADGRLRCGGGRTEWHKVRSGPGAGQVQTRTLTSVSPPPTRLPLRVWDNAHAIPPRGDAIVYLDPPYAGTKGYARGVSFSVPDLVADWTQAGATVLVSETTPLPGCEAFLDISGARKSGGARNIGGTPEYLSVYAPVQVHNE